jgi:protein involved in polysaccharide export with SLBB domain
MRRAAVRWLAFLAIGFAVLPGKPTTGDAQTMSRERRLQGLEPEEQVILEEQLQSETTTRAAASAALAGPIDPKHYRLGPGDVLALEYTGTADLSRRLTVDGEGRIRVPNLGSMDVGGRTLAEVREEILTGLKPYITGAIIDLRMITPRVFKVYVVGSVENAGVVEVRGSARVVEALDAAGGLQSQASRRNIRVLRQDDQEVIADMQDFLWTGDWSANPYLEDGDRIIVPQMTQTIRIAGAVARTGLFEYRPGDTLADLIMVAGGPLTQARLDSVLVIRFRGADELDTLVVNVDEINDGVALDTPIFEDDRIFVRGRAQWHPARQVAISGEVYYPGSYAIQEGVDRVSDLIRWAGSYTPQAFRKGVRLLRRTEIEGQDVEFERLSRLTRAEMTDTEYQAFRGKLAIRQAAYLIDFSDGQANPPESDVHLKGGDVVEVEKVELSVRVDGNVLRPGFIAYEPGKTVSGYIEMAGGTSARADLSKTRLTHAGSTESQLANSGWEVEPGDFIWVPEKKDTSFWDTFKDVIAVAGQMAAIVLLLDTLSRN